MKSLQQYILESKERIEVGGITFKEGDRVIYLKKYKDENGDKPKGDAALGVNGVESDEYFAAIADYKQKYNIQSDEEFIEHIEKMVVYGESL